MPERINPELNVRKEFMVAVALFLAAAALFMVVLWFAPVRMDEVWCFAFSNRIQQGWLPYQDFNLVIPPLFPWMGALTAGSLILYRIFGALLAAGIVLASYGISRMSDLSTRETVFRTVGMFLLLFWYPDANYNLLLVFCLLLSYMSGRRLIQGHRPGSAWAIGCFLMMACLTKQNIGAVALLATLAYFVVMTRKGVLPAGSCPRMIGGASAPAAAVLVYFLATGTGGDFLDFGLFGLGGFSSNLVWRPEAAPFAVLAVGFLALMVMDFVKNHPNRAAAGLALCIGVPSILLVFPIADGYHALVVCILLGGMMPSVSLRMKRAGVWPVVLAVAFLLILSGARITMITSAAVDSTRMTMPPYQGVLFPADLAEEVEAVSKYIWDREAEGQDVAVISPVAYLYTLPADDNNQYLDLVARGNMGRLTLDDLLAMSAGKDILLVRDHAHWQEDPGLREALLSKYPTEGKIGDFWILRVSETEQP
jgi:hypothetical protein